MNKDRLIPIFFVIAILVCSAFIFYDSYIHSEIPNNIKYRTITKNIDIYNVDELIDVCDNGDLEQTLKCINYKIGEKYIYRIRQSDDIISFENLFNNGGDCSDWAYFWRYVARRINVNELYVTIPMNEKLLHRFNVISDGTTYCTVDLQTIYCFEMIKER